MVGFGKVRLAGQSTWRAGVAVSFSFVFKTGAFCGIGSKRGRRFE